LKKEDQIYGRGLDKMEKKHISETFYLLDDPLESAAFSAMVGDAEGAADRLAYERKVTF
jgi:hypothetical protein